MLTNLKDEIGMQLLPVIQPLIMRLVELGKDVLPVLVSWLGTNVPIAIKFLSTMWTNVLQPAIAKVNDFMQTVVIPFIREHVIPFLQVAVPAALQILAGYWENVLKPAIETWWNWMSTVIVPFFNTVILPLLRVSLPVAIQILSDFWTNILQPAIAAVFKYLNETLIPFIANQVVPWIAENLPAGLQTLSDAFMGVRDFVRDEIGPRLVWFRDEVLLPLRDAIQWVVDKVKKLIDKWKKLRDSLRDAQNALPDWMTPGSPTPWEMGLRGVADAMTDLSTRSIPMLQGSIAGGGGTMAQSTTNNYYNLSVTAGSSAGIRQDFGTMRALAGGV